MEIVVGNDGDLAFKLIERGAERWSWVDWFFGVNTWLLSRRRGLVRTLRRACDSRTFTGEGWPRLTENE